MPGIIGIIILLWVASAIGKRAKRLSANRPGQAPQPRQPSAPRPNAPRPNAPRPNAPRPSAWPDMLPPELREFLNMEPEEQAPPPIPDADMAEGASREGISSEGTNREAPDGFLGGSLPLQEGYVPFAPARPIAAIVPERAEPASVALSPEDLRRAVVVSELLARPVSLRARGHRL